MNDGIIGFCLEQRSDGLVFADFDADDSIRLAPQDQPDAYDSGRLAKERILIVRMSHDSHRPRTQSVSVARAEWHE